MQIQWLGLGAFRIQTKQAVLITDPYSDNSGLTMPKMKAEIVVVSNRDNALANNVARLQGDPVLVDGPGEFEVQGAFIYGVPGSSTVYLIEDEGMKVAFLGSLDSALTNQQLELIEGSDILLLPIGTLDKEQRSMIVSQIEPRIVVPYLYAQPKVKTKLESLETWLKEMGDQKPETLEKINIKKKDLPQEETIINVLRSTT